MCKKRALKLSNFLNCTPKRRICVKPQKWWISQMVVFWLVQKSVIFVDLLYWSRNVRISQSAVLFFFVPKSAYCGFLLYTVVPTHIWLNKYLILCCIPSFCDRVFWFTRIVVPYRVHHCWFHIVFDLQALDVKNVKSFILEKGVFNSELTCSLNTYANAPPNSRTTNIKSTNRK